jgi:hypothetical protein
MKITVSILFVTGEYSSLVMRSFAAVPRVGEWVAAREGSAGRVTRVEWMLGGDPLVTVALSSASQHPFA